MLQEGPYLSHFSMLCIFAMGKEFLINETIFELYDQLSCRLWYFRWSAEDFFLPPLGHKNHQNSFFTSACSEQAGGLENRVWNIHIAGTLDTYTVCTLKNSELVFIFNQVRGLSWNMTTFFLHAQPTLFSHENRVLYHFSRTGRHYTEKCYRMCSCPVIGDT